MYNPIEEKGMSTQEEYKEYGVVTNDERRKEVVLTIKIVTEKVWVEDDEVRALSGYKIFATRTLAKINGEEWKGERVDILEISKTHIELRKASATGTQTFLRTDATEHDRIVEKEIRRLEETNGDIETYEQERFNQEERD